MPVDIDAGFEVAPGDASDVEVANAHAWGSYCLVYSDGAAAHSARGIAMIPSVKGIARAISASEILFYNLMMISGVKGGSGHLTVDSSRRVSAYNDNNDVLLRKRA